MRLVIAGFHTALAIALASGASMVLFQARLNVLWESSFYGQVSEFTTLLTVLPAALLVLSSASFTCAVAYLLEKEWAPMGLLATSLPLALLTPAPLNWLVTAAALGIGVELWQRLPPVPEEEQPE